MRPDTHPLLTGDEVDLTRVTRACYDGRPRDCTGRVRLLTPGQPGQLVDCACPYCQHQPPAKRVQPTPLRKVLRDAAARHLPDVDPHTLDQLADAQLRELQNYRRRLTDARRAGHNPPDDEAPNR